MSWPTKAVLVMERDKLLGLVERQRDFHSGEVTWIPIVLNTDLTLSVHSTLYTKRTDAMKAVRKSWGL